MKTFGEAFPHVPALGANSIKAISWLDQRPYWGSNGRRVRFHTSPTEAPAESPLSFPTTLDGEWLKAGGLLERMRKQGLSGEGGYAEAVVHLVTGH